MIDAFTNQTDLDDLIIKLQAIEITSVDLAQKSMAALVVQLFYKFQIDGDDDSDIKEVALNAFSALLVAIKLMPAELSLSDVTIKAIEASVSKLWAAYMVPIRPWPGHNIPAIKKAYEKLLCDLFGLMKDNPSIFKAIEAAIADLDCDGALAQLQYGLAQSREDEARKERQNYSWAYNEYYRINYGR